MWVGAKEGGHGLKTERPFFFPGVGVVYLFTVVDFALSRFVTKGTSEKKYGGQRDLPFPALPSYRDEYHMSKTPSIRWSMEPVRNMTGSTSVLNNSYYRYVISIIK
jgi:hypothetical protein